MNDRRHQPSQGAVGAFAVAVLNITLFALLPVLTGCVGDAGTGGTGELVVPRETLREIDGMELDRVAASTQPLPPPATRPSTLPRPDVPLSIEEARRLALQNNLDLRVELLEPTIARTAVSIERAAFESLFVADASYLSSDTPTASLLSGSQVKDFSGSAGIDIPLITGGTARFDLPINRFETNNEFSTLNPSYSSDFSASLTHNLLRGAGVRTNTQGIRVAFYNYQISQALTKLQIIRILAAVDRVYWRLYAARQELQVRQKEHELAVELLERSRVLFEAEIVPDIDIVRAESGVADSLEAIIIAENQVRDRQRELKRLINEPGLEMASPTRIVITTTPNATPYRIDPDRLIATALDRRMELLETELRIARETSQVAFARNGLLPLVLLDYTYNVNGLGDSFDQSFELLSDKNFEDHRVGLRVEVPVGNLAARSRLRRALAGRMQALASHDQRAQLVIQEVLNAIDQLEANWQRIVAAQRRVVLAARVLEGEIQQFDLGLRTSTDVLDAQARLADAQSSEINALTEYQIAQVDIAFAAGMILGSSNVIWDPVGVPRR